MLLFENFQSKKSDPNVRQNAPNCTIFKNFLGGACPRTPPSRAHGFAMRSMSRKNLKKKFLALPPSKSWGRPCNSISYKKHKRYCNCICT